MATPRTRYANYQPTQAPATPVAPSPADATSPAVAPSPRYAYLVGRLQNRQITMEEATELFDYQQRTISSILAQANQPPAPVTPAAPAQAAPSPSGVSVSFNDDSIGVGLLALGTAAGLFAAILSRATEQRRTPAARDQNRPA
jgi:hypothetical protein